MEDCVELRPARPTEDEGRRFARYANEASHGLVQRLFGKSFERILATMFLSPGHDMSYETTVFAVVDEEIVGMASCFSAEEHGRSSSKPMLAAAGIHLIRIVPIAILGMRLFRFINTVPDGDYYVSAVAVEDGRRGLGIGSVLLDDIDERALGAGCRRVALDVAADNPEARRLYERRGMTMEAESPSVLFASDRRVQRMVKVL